MKHQHHTIALLILIMTTVAVTVGGIAIYLLYREAYSQKQNDLTKSTQAMSSLIEAVAQFDRKYSEHTHPQGHVGATLSQVSEAFRQHPVLGDGEEWIVGQQQGDEIRFLISANKHGLKRPESIPLNGAMGKGMRLALQGQSGIKELTDYRGYPCLVAYAPIPTLGVGIVNKMELAQIRAPFIRAAWIAAGLGSFAIGLGIFLFLRIGQGITHRLRQSEQRLSGIVQASPVGVFETDAAGNCLFVNERWCEIAGMSAEEAKGQGWVKTLHPDDLLRIKEEWGRTVDSSAPFKSEYRFIRSGKTPTWVFGQAAALINGDGKPSGFVGTITDITERKQMEDMLRTSEANLATAQRISHIGNWVWEIESGKLAWSDEVYRIFGFEPQAFDASYAAFLQSVHADDQRIVTEGVAQALERIKPYSVDHRVVRPDGSIITVHEQGEVAFNGEGKPVRMIGTVQDVTLQKHYETELKSLNENLETQVESRMKDLRDERNFISTLMETIGALVVVMDSDGRIVRFNKACERTTGFTLDEVKGRYLWDMLIPPELVETVQQVFSQLPETPPPSHFENDWLTKSGERRLISWSNTTVQDLNGATLVVSSGIDITRHQQAENALIQAKVEAEVANNAKSAFLSRMSHELRTPLNAILGFSQLLESDTDHPLAADQVENVQEILKAGYRLLDLVNEVLDLARIESGNMNCRLEPLLVAEVIENSISAITPLAQQRQISLISKVTPCNQSYVMADSTRLRQVLINLLSNAVKYNKQEGSILLGCEELDSTIRISITDTGKGIESPNLAHLFMPFERLGAEFTDTNGTGIGLALSKQLMALMGGDIGAGSTVGQGSTFWIALPAAPPPTNVEAAEKQLAEQVLIGSNKVNILFVEDNPANFRLVKAMLSRYPGFALLPARTAEIGLELAKLHKPDIVLMDINLPGMDGYQGLAWLRANAETCNIPVIAVTADAMPHDMERGMNAGFFAYLTKPVDANDLLATISLALKWKDV